MQNKKIIGAVKTAYKGKVYDSKTEAYFASLLTISNISFESPKVFILQDGFRYLGNSIRPITLKVDFWLPAHNTLVDIKGFFLEDARLKFKLLKMKLSKEGAPPAIEMPRTKQECENLILRLTGKL